MIPVDFEKNKPRKFMQGLFIISRHKSN